MKKKDQPPDDDARGQFLVYAAEDGRIKIDVRLADETVWLTQPLMADLFQTTQQNISQHIRNVYEEGELVPEATNKKFLLVRLRAVPRRPRNLSSLPPRRFTRAIPDRSGSSAQRFVCQGGSL